MFNYGIGRKLITDDYGAKIGKNNNRPLRNFFRNVLNLVGGYNNGWGHYGNHHSTRTDWMGTILGSRWADYGIMSGLSSNIGWGIDRMNSSSKLWTELIYY